MSNPQGSPRRAPRRQFLRHGLATAGALAALPDGAVAAPPVPSAASLSEVQARMQAQTAAWNRGDIAGFCAAYAEDCIFISPSGVTRGRRVVQERYSKKYGAAQATMGQLEFELLDQRSSSDFVSLALRWRLSWPRLKPEKPAQSGSTLIVWQRLPGGWFLVQDASM